MTTFFCFYDTPDSSSSTLADLDLYLNDSASQLETLNRYPLVKQVLIAKNTALLSNAPTERLFSIGQQILTPDRIASNETTAISGDLSGYFFGIFRDKASSIIWRHATSCQLVTGIGAV